MMLSQELSRNPVSLKKLEKLFSCVNYAQKKKKEKGWKTGSKSQRSTSLIKVALKLMKV